MPIACRHKLQYGTESCASDCPVTAPSGLFKIVRIERPEDVPPAEERAVDIALLDMNHGWPNLGHDSLVHAVRDSACDLVPLMEETGLRLRIFSHEVRCKAMVPEPPGRFAVYVGSGGPGGIDPRVNDGVSEGSQGIKEDPAWEKPLFALFDAIQADPNASLLAVCHTFGVLCRWSGAAHPVLRGPEKGGKSTGVLENVLSREAIGHPWFSRFAAELPDGRRLRVVDNRLYDLVPDPAGLPEGAVPIGYETAGPGHGALTMIELARDPGGVMPRIFAVNHHPEIVDRVRQMMLLRQKRDRGEVTTEWFEERALILTQTYPEENSDLRLRLTSDYTLLAPLRFHILRQVRLRAEALGLKADIHEDRILDALDGAAVIPAGRLEGSGAF